MDFNPTVWYGYVAPAKTPAEIVDRLYQAFAKAVNEPGRPTTPARIWRDEDDTILKTDTQSVMPRAFAKTDGGDDPSPN